MKRPLVVILLYFISGIFAGWYISDNLSIFLFIAIGFFTCILLYVFYKWDKVFLFIIALFIGFASILFRNLPENTSIEESALFNTPVTVDALVLKPSAGNGFIAETVPEKVKILVYSNKIKVKAGDTIILTGAAQHLQTLRNSGGFDEKMYYAARGIKYKMYPQYADMTGYQNNLNSLIYNLREKLSDVYDICLPEKEAGIMKSIIIGDRSQLLDEVKYLYSTAGIYHILAISGLHISVIGLFLNILLNLFMSKRASGIVTFSILTFYCLLTGASPSTVRAVTICAVLIFGRLIFRKNDQITSLAFACLCILLYNPFYLWDLGFQLSFSAMAGIILLSNPLDTFFIFLSSKIPLLKKFFENFWVKQSLTVSIAVYIASIPIGTYYLSSISTYSVLVNIILFPTFFLLVTAGFITGCAGLIYLPAGMFFSGILYYMLNLYEIILNFFVNLPASTILTGYIPLYITIPYYLFVGVCAYYLFKLPNSKKLNKYLFSSFTILLISICLHNFVPHSFYVTMLDVNQGDCFVLKKDGFTAVIDGGGWANVPIGKNTGSKILIPYLNYLGVNKVDIAFITHLENDHTAGIIELLENKKVKTLCIPANTDKESPTYAQVIKIAAQNNVELKLLKKGDVYTNRDIVLSCLHPGNDPDLFDINDNSLVLKLEYKSNSFLFTGDITKRAEKILTNDKNINAQVLKLSHHGSKYSNSEEFLNAVSPGLAIVSYSKYNNYGLLPDELLISLAQKNIPLLKTAEHGAVTLISDGKNIRIKRSVR